MSNELTRHIMQIVGEPAGGIRRHVHSIIFGLRGIPDLKQSYVCSASGGDAGFRKDLPELTEALDGRLLNLNIGKKPALSDISNLLRLARYVKEQNVSMIHGHGAKGGAYARLLAGLCGIKAVYTPHGGAVHKMFGWAEDKLYTAAEKLFFGFTDYFLFESSYTAEAYFAKVGKKPKNWTINYNGIPFPDTAVIHRESQAFGYAPGTGGSLNIGVFGILRPQKGQLYAIKAAAELVSRGIKVKLHIYGKGPDKAALESEVSRLGLAGTVIFHGEVDNPESHMSVMDIILIPSLFEAFGYVAVEAFALKKPVIASAAGGLREILTDGETGLLIQPQNSAAIATAVETFIKDPDKSRLLAARGYEKFLADFTLCRMLENLSGIYRELSR